MAARSLTGPRTCRSGGPGGGPATRTLVQPIGKMLRQTAAPETSRLRKNPRRPESGTVPPSPAARHRQRSVGSRFYFPHTGTPVVTSPFHLNPPAIRTLVQQGGPYLAVLSSEAGEGGQRTLPFQPANVDDRTPVLLPSFAAHQTAPGVPRALLVCSH